MDEDWKPLAIGVRLDRQQFCDDTDEIRKRMEEWKRTAEMASRAIEHSLLRAVASGKLGFEDLKKAALSMMDAIAAKALKAGIAAILHGGAEGAGAGQAGGGLIGALAGLLAGGVPGRATGGPVSPARPYIVGERGPELFVPTAAGRVEPSALSPAREVRVAITVNAAAGEAPAMLQRSSRQVARAVRAALEA